MAVTAKDYNARAAQALKRARELLGDPSGAAFARRMRERWGAPADSTYLRWEAEKQEVPAWAQLAAAELAGVAIEDLTGGRATRPMLNRLGSVEDRIDGIDGRVERIEGLFEDLLRRLPSAVQAS